MNAVTVAFQPNRRAKLKPPEPAPIRLRPARIARQLALAHALQRRVDSGEFADYAMLARAVGFSRARITQLMALLLLAPDIQQELLLLTSPPGRQALTERALRPVVDEPHWGAQRALWAALRRSLDSVSLPGAPPSGGTGDESKLLTESVDYEAL